MVNDLSKKAPRHVGIIMDGNGRWAALRGQKRSFGHRAGVKAIEEVAETLFGCGVEYISLYAFSSENFSRPKEEIDYLFNMLKDGITRYGENCLKKKVRLLVSGDLSSFDQELRDLINSFIQKTSKFSSPVMNICLNYGARQELCRAFNLMAQANEKTADEVVINKYLYNDLPDLDLVIRSGGEQRLSNFMLWQASYAELYFTDLLWPDFNKEATLNALEWYYARKRRFGKILND